MKIAYFSPLNPVKSGISDYSEELLPYLARQASIDLFVNGYQPTNPDIVKNFRVFDIRRINPLDYLPRYDMALYHMGNSPAHRYIYDILLQWPGVVVLHDYCLHNFLAQKFFAEGRPERYLEELEYCHGQEGLSLIEDPRAFLHWEDMDPLRYPLNKRVLDTATGVIVHSNFVKQLLTAAYPHILVKQLNHHVVPEEVREVSPSERVAILERYSLPFDAVLVSCFGYLNTKKRIESVLHAIASLRSSFPIHCLLVGEALPGAEGLGPLISALGMEESVTRTGFVNLKIFRDLVNATDICLSLRYPTMGETSGSLCRLMAAGKACVVSNVGWFAELPDSCVIKVDADAQEVDRLRSTLWELIVNEPLRSRIGANARTYIATHHRIEDSAREYLAFCTEVHRHKNSQEWDVAAAECFNILADIGVEERDAFVYQALGEVLSEMEDLTPDGGR
jgi:glycosyltransferase involved in cell wall biosynthesis